MSTAPDGWFPIHSAPKGDPADPWKRTIILTCIEGDDDSVRLSYWEPESYSKKPRPYWRDTATGNRLGDTRSRQPTHWQPRPYAKRAKGAS